MKNIKRHNVTVMAEATEGAKMVTAEMCGE
jgi:hypothetical protein